MLPLTLKLLCCIIPSEVIETTEENAMFYLKKPARDTIQQYLTLRRDDCFSYSAVEGTRDKNAPERYVVDHNRVRLGSGREVFEQAKTALRQWEMFNLGWIQLCWPETPVEVGSTVGVLARLGGVWSLNLCRIVYVIGEADDAVETFGFAYGTLPDHAERGEERFTVEWYQADDSVWYDIFAFSRPKQLLAQIGYPVARRLQKRFAVDSMAAMCRVIGN